MEECAQGSREKQRTAVQNGENQRAPCWVVVGGFEQRVWGSKRAHIRSGALALIAGNEKARQLTLV